MHNFFGNQLFLGLISEEISRAGHKTMVMSRDRTIRVIKLYASVYYVYISVADVTSRTG